MSKEFTNVWDAIEQDPAKAANLKMRSELMMKISAYVNQSNLTQTRTAEKLGRSEEHTSELQSH